MSRYYPAYLDLAGRRAVVIGGGPIAERKAQQLLAAGADVMVVAPKATPELESLAAASGVRWVRRDYVVGDLAGAWIAIAATDDMTVNRAVHLEAERERALLNVVDQTELCGFIAPSIVERGPVTVAISTAGASPALARKLRELIGGDQNPPHYDHEPFCRCLEWADAAGVLSEVRAELKARNQPAAPEAWQDAMDATLLDLVLAGKHDDARRRLRDALTLSPSDS